jgi:proline iminopeptidase
VSAEERGEVEVEGGTVRYRILGSGDRTLVLLHGGPGVPSGYLRPLEALADGRRVVVYDQLGCGASDHPADPSLWRAERFVDELETLRSHLGLEQMDLLGHSWGGMLAIDYALAHQNRLRALVLASTIADAPFLKRETERLLGELGPDGETIRRCQAAGELDDPEYAAAVDTFYAKHVCRVEQPPDLVEALAATATDVYGAMWGPNEIHFVGNLDEWSRLDRLHEIRVPTLITVGEHDELTPACSRQILGEIEGSRLVVFPGCSHLTFHEEPVEYVRTVDEFLRGV